MEAYQSSFDGEPGYLDWAAFGPLSPGVRSEVHADAELLGSGRSSSIDLVAEHAREARQLVAELVGGDEGQVTLQPSTSYGLMHAVFGLSGTVIASTAEFPSITVSLTRAAEAFGRVTPRWVTPESGAVTPEAVRDALDDDVTAVMVSLVDFRTGYRADLGALREVIGPDRLLIVDAIQGFGVVDAEYAAADVVCSNGYKWLRAGRGTGFAWFGDRALERIAPVLSGFAGVEGGLPMDEVPRPAASAKAFTVSNPDALAAARLATGLREVRDAGVARIESELVARTRDVIQSADRFEIPVATPREAERRAGIVALAPPAADVAPLGAALANHGLTVTARGGLIRVAPHVGTGAETLRLFGDALAAFAQSRVW
ncbi:aminotransferase class V-fold PLP-dependent enzyme [Microbacterium sp. DT81.1]|uniref:aminotransferase class V-fold PLP-dependent enzyme n=1 Tax=Microbacterium sp. DT81.1 TaxID=3393413 RepID=UPI003CF20F08